MTGGATAAGSSRSTRLDPRALPYGPINGTGGTAGAAFTINRERAIVIVTVPGSGRTRDVPLGAYRGVAARIEAGNGPGRVHAFVELLHADPSLTLTLIAADDPEEVAADWQAWGRALNLPLLVIAADGTVSTALERIGAVTLGPPKPRRRHSFFAARRPRFLTRRKPGRRQPTARVDGHEIIARN